jgi:hypothetical protein
MEEVFRFADDLGPAKIIQCMSRSSVSGQRSSLTTSLAALRSVAYGWRLT